MMKWICSLLTFSAICSVPLSAHPRCYCPPPPPVVVQDVYYVQPVMVQPQPVMVPCYYAAPCYPCSGARISLGGSQVCGHSSFGWSVSFGC